MKNHTCKYSDIGWDDDVESDGAGFYYVGTCSICDKKYQQTFSEDDGLWDEEIQDRVFI